MAPELEDGSTILPDESEFQWTENDWDDWDDGTLYDHLRENAADSATQPQALLNENTGS